MDDILNLRVKEVIPETKDALTLVLENANGEPVAYEAGQFLTLIIDAGGKELRRSYSLSSSPEADANPAITVKRVQNGEISRYLFSTISKGSVLRSLPPAGRFTVRPSPKFPRDIFLLAAGSGIVPLFSILKTVLKKEPEARVHLICSNHNAESVIFRKPLVELQDIYKGRFNCVHVLSDLSSRMPGVIHGHLNNIMLEELLNEYLQYDKEHAAFYICGPFAYMRMITITLPLLDFSREQIHREVFLTEINESVSGIPGGNIASDVTILAGGKEYLIHIPAGKTILKAAAENGIKLPYSCEAGICSTCSAQCTRGKVEMSVNEVLTAKDINDGLILTCTGYPVTGAVQIKF